MFTDGNYVALESAEEVVATVVVIFARPGHPGDILEYVHGDFFTDERGRIKVRPDAVGTEVELLASTWLHHVMAPVFSVQSQILYITVDS